MLQDLKTMLGTDNAWTDDRLILLLQDTTQMVLAYCNITTLPAMLEPVVRQIAFDHVKKIDIDNVASVKRGDTQVTYAAPTTQTLSLGQIASLNRYRRIIKR